MAIPSSPSEPITTADNGEEAHQRHSERGSVNRLASNVVYDNARIDKGQSVSHVQVRAAQQDGNYLYLVQYVNYYK
jgi:hypothetical protein